MKQKTYKLFIFDFDGTLGDTEECVIASYQQTFIDNHLPQASRADIIHSMGLSLSIALRKLTNNTLEATSYDKLVSDYRTHYRHFLKEKTQIFPEVKETLQTLKSQGKLLSIATSKKTVLAQMSCKFLDIEPYFDLIVGDDMVTKKKPDPEMLVQTLDALNVDKKDAVIVGDSIFDIQMGNTLGVDTVAVTWGAHSIDMLTTAKPRYIINRFSELLRFA